MKRLEGECYGLLEIHTDLQNMLQLQTGELESIEAAAEKSLEKVQKGVLDIAESARMNGSNIKMKCTLWGTGIGATVGGIGGATVGFIGTPVLSVVGEHAFFKI